MVASLENVTFNVNPKKEFSRVLDACPANNYHIHQHQMALQAWIKVIVYHHVLVQHHHVKACQATSIGLQWLQVRIFKEYFSGFIFYLHFFLNILEVSNLHIGDRVIVSSAFGSRPGVLKFLGEVQFAVGTWCGIHLDDDSGKNDGTVSGHR